MSRRHPLGDVESLTSNDEDDEDREWEILHRAVERKPE